ncbi:MAG: sigma-54 interaction domain-containing protein [Desulfatiglandales bacterium]
MDRLKKERKRPFEFEVLLEAFHDGVVIIEDGEVQKVNGSFCRITGLKKDAIENRTLSELSNSSHVCLRSVSEVCSLSQNMKKTITILRKMTQGNEIFITSTPIIEERSLRGFMVIIRDVTELKHLQEQVSELSGLYLTATQDDTKQKLIADGIIAESPSMRRLIELVIRIAKVDSVILIEGESGTGKEVLARLIHRLSSRAKNPFVSINCAAIPEPLLESELFGYEKGAFSGALREGKLGLFELADGGTLFLDEIGELPFSLQAKLLRFLQDQEVYRVGGIRPIRLNVRIIAATNKRLDEMVEGGRFREDLFYRLHVVPIYVPPLRERKEDIFPLAWRFLQHFNQKYKQAKSLSPALISSLESYHWPGNVRELQNIIERLVVTSETNVLRPKDLPLHIPNGHKIKGILEDSKELSIRKAREEAEKSLLLEACLEGKTMREMGDILGVHHSTVIRKLRKYGIKREGAI